MFLTKLLIVVFGILFQLLGLLSSDVVDILSNALTVRAVCGFDLYPVSALEAA